MQSVEIGAHKESGNNSAAWPKSAQQLKVQGATATSRMQVLAQGSSTCEQESRHKDTSSYMGVVVGSIHLFEVDKVWW